MATRALRGALKFALRAASVALALALITQSWQLMHAVRVNRQLAARLADPAAQTVPLGEDPRLWVAAARQPARAGRTAEAAALLHRAADASLGELRSIALYDLGNLYLQAALQLPDPGANGSALPLFELAKQSYRSALMERADLWDAKFNLELALRVAPDPDPDDAGAPPVLTGERAVTTMRAFTLGLP